MNSEERGGKMSDLRKKIYESVEFIQKEASLNPQIGIILGTGLGALAEEIKDKESIAYGSIPNFAVSTVKSHKGELVFGKIAKKSVVMMEGRFHLYEGYTPVEVTFPVRVMRALGIKILIVTNAAGGLNPAFSRGDIMLVSDHINLTGLNPLVGPNDDSLGTRFPDMSQPYDRKLIALAEKIGIQEKLNLKRGVFAGLSGPCLETAAEYKFLKVIGADAVAMSMVHEVIVGVHAGTRNLGISVVTDMCIPETLKPANIEEIIKAANDAEPKLMKLVRGFVEEVNV